MLWLCQGEKSIKRDPLLKDKLSKMGYPQGNYLTEPAFALWRTNILFGLPYIHLRFVSLRALIPLFS